MVAQKHDIDQNVQVRKLAPENFAPCPTCVGGPDLFIWSIFLTGHKTLGVNIKHNAHATQTILVHKSKFAKMLKISTHIEKFGQGALFHLTAIPFASSQLCI